MALLQICTTPLGPGLPSPATLLFNQPVCSIMHVLDRKPVGEDYDDEHYSRLVDRQHKNDNDASPMFAYIPIGSAVVVQWEDGGLWTHGSIVGTGDHNHNYHSYTIQLTTNGRRITCNRQHIRPASVTADAYMQYQATKHIHKQIALLEDILEPIRNNPMAYAMPQQNNSNNIQKTNNKQQANNGQQGRRQDPRQKTLNTQKEDTGYTQ